MSVSNAVKRSSGSHRVNDAGSPDYPSKSGLINKHTVNIQCPRIHWFPVCWLVGWLVGWFVGWGKVCIATRACARLSPD